MRALIVLLILSFLGGCASYFTPRPPVIEDKVGIKKHEKVGTLSTAPDYRVVYVRLDETAQLCAEAPADAGAQFGSTFAAGLTGPLGGTEKLTPEAKVSLAVAMKQLFKRSQGVQLYRDGVFALCNMHLNKVISAADYLGEMRELRKAATFLVEKEIPYLVNISIDPIAVPTPSTPPNLDTKSSTSGDKSDPEVTDPK